MKIKKIFIYRLSFNFKELFLKKEAFNFTVVKETSTQYFAKLDNDINMYHELFTFDKNDACHLLSFHEGKVIDNTYVYETGMLYLEDENGNHYSRFDYPIPKGDLEYMMNSISNNTNDFANSNLLDFFNKVKEMETVYKKDSVYPTKFKKII